MLAEVKLALGITFDDDDIDNRVNRLIEENKRSFEMLIGEKIDYTKDDVARQLLVNRIRYDYNNVVDLFEDNFKHEILRYQLTREYGNVAETNGQ